MFSFLSGSAFALSCPETKDVVHELEWVIPEGWALISQINNAEKLSPYLQASATPYGHLRCAYKSNNGELIIEFSDFTNTHIKFSDYWLKDGTNRYKCICPTEYLHVCSYESNIS